MSVLCLNTIAGIGTQCKTGNPFAGLLGLVFADPDFTFDASSKFADSDEWATGIVAGQLFPVMGVKEDEDTTPDDVIWESPYGDKVFITEGKYAKTYKLILTLEQHKKLREYTGKKWKVYKIDRNNNIKATVDEDGNYNGFDISFMRISKMADATADTPAMTSIMIEETDPKQWNEKGAYVTPSWLASEEIIPLSEVTLTSSVVAANVFTITVNFDAGLNADGSVNNIPISGLVPGNLIIVDQDGDTLSNAGDYTVTESTTDAGEYEVDATVGTITSGTCQVVATTAALYRSDVLAITA